MDFDLYQQNQQTLSQVIRHTTSSIKILQTRIVQWTNATEKEIQADLDLIHLIFKHARACCSSFASVCAAQNLYPQLAQFVLDQTNDGKTTAPSYSLLVCMIDLVKRDSLFPLSSSQLHNFVAIASPLWSQRKIYMCRKSMELCYRLMSSVIDNDHGSIIVNNVILYIRQCRTHMTRADVERIRSDEYTEFYFNGSDTLPMIYDRTTFKWLVQIIFAVFSKQIGDHLALINEIKVDLLLETDSGFISYFQRYIVYATQNMDAFKDAIHSNHYTDLDTIQSIIANVTLVIEGIGFPYNAKPLIRRLANFEKKLSED
ncbi:hypothetical protein [Parasitella parasitica]|uniref:Uncharacterized protein n=1 Tax=Parasitella parasitica TaxID=35722 RepID=A0A0B7MP26_9FUNG|nr:hypothetical protein [Parasitella parasitica]